MLLLDELLILSACDLRALGPSSAPGSDHLSTHVRFAAFGRAPFHGPTRFPQAPFQCPRSQAATLELGHATRFSLPSRRRDCISSRLRALIAEEYDRLVTESIATLETAFLVATLDRAVAR